MKPNTPHSKLLFSFFVTYLVATPFEIIDISAEPAEYTPVYAQWIRYTRLTDIDYGYRVLYE